MEMEVELMKWKWNIRNGMELEVKCKCVTGMNVFGNYYILLVPRVDLVVFGKISHHPPAACANLGKGTLPTTVEGQC